MTAFAVPGEFDAALSCEQIDVLGVPGIAEGVGMDGLVPLREGLLMAVAAVLCTRKTLRVNEQSGVGCGIGGEKRTARAKWEGVMLGHVLGVDRPLRCGF